MVAAQKLLAIEREVMEHLCPQSALGCVCIAPERDERKCPRINDGLQIGFARVRHVGANLIDREPFRRSSKQWFEVRAVSGMLIQYLHR